MVMRGALGPRGASVLPAVPKGIFGLLTQSQPISSFPVEKTELLQQAKGTDGGVSGEALITGKGRKRWETPKPPSRVKR